MHIVTLPRGFRDRQSSCVFVYVQVNNNDIYIYTYISSYITKTHVYAILKTHVYAIRHATQKYWLIAIQILKMLDMICVCVHVNVYVCRDAQILTKSHCRFWRCWTWLRENARCSQCCTRSACSRWGSSEPCVCVCVLYQFVHSDGRVSHVCVCVCVCLCMLYQCIYGEPQVKDSPKHQKSIKKEQIYLATCISSRTYTTEIHTYVHTRTGIW